MADIRPSVCEGRRRHAQVAPDARRQRRVRCPKATFRHASAISGAQLLTDWLADPIASQAQAPATAVTPSTSHETPCTPGRRA